MTQFLERRRECATEWITNSRAFLIQRQRASEREQAKKGQQTRTPHSTAETLNMAHYNICAFFRRLFHFDYKCLIAISLVLKFFHYAEWTRDVVLWFACWYAWYAIILMCTNMKLLDNQINSRFQLVRLLTDITHTHTSDSRAAYVLEKCGSVRATKWPFALAADVKCANTNYDVSRFDGLCR